MAKDFEWNAARGTWYEYEDDPQTGDLIIHTKQDVTANLDWAKKQRNSGNNDLGGRRDDADLKHYAHIPPIVELQLKEKGIDIANRDHLPRLIQEIETNYPLCKVTNRKIWKT